MLKNNKQLLLKDINPHPRDKDIIFKEKGHVYYVKSNNDYTSVTKIVHNAFNPFNADKIIDNMMNSPNWENSKYFGMSKDQIKNAWRQNGRDAANMGTIMHSIFEYYYNNINLDKIENYKDTIEYNYFKKFIKDHSHLVPYRTEWNVYHEDHKIAGSIDMTFINPNGTLSIYDWKRCKNIDKYGNFGKFSIKKGLEHIRDTNYWHYTLQLNLYKYILETKYGFKVEDLHIVVIHPENNFNTYEKFMLPILKETVILSLLSSDNQDKDNNNN
jgi:hypothetical protein